MSLMLLLGNPLICTRSVIRFHFFDSFTGLELGLHIYHCHKIECTIIAGPSVKNCLKISCHNIVQREVSKTSHVPFEHCMIVKVITSRRYRGKPYSQNEWKLINFLKCNGKCLKGQMSFPRSMPCFIPLAGRKHGLLLSTGG